MRAALARVAHEVDGDVDANSRAHRGPRRRRGGRCPRSGRTRRSRARMGIAPYRAGTERDDLEPSRSWRSKSSAIEIGGGVLVECRREIADAQPPSPPGTIPAASRRSGTSRRDPRPRGRDAGPPATTTPSIGNGGLARSPLQHHAFERGACVLDAAPVDTPPCARVAFPQERGAGSISIARA